MAKRTARSLSIDESLLLLELRERGLKAKPKDVVEALEQLECTYDAEKQRFYLPREFQTVRDGQPLVTTSPDPTDLVAADKEFVLNLVCSYLLGSSYEENGAVVDGARFLPDPSGPTTDLEELAKEQARVREQKKERMERRMFIYNNISVREDAAVAKRELSGYMSLFEQHMPDLALPGKEDASERQAHIERFFTEVVAVRGQTALEQYVEDLEIVASAGVAEVTAAFVQSAPTLYHKLSVEGVKKFVTAGLEELQEYKTITLPSVLGNVVGYFSLSSDEAKQTMTDLIEKEHDYLVPTLAKVERSRRDLERALSDSTQENRRLQNTLSEKIRAYEVLEKGKAIVKDSLEKTRDSLTELQQNYDQLELKYKDEAEKLEKERDKSARLEDSGRGKDTAYKTASQHARDLESELGGTIATLVDTRANFDKYKTETVPQKLRKIGIITGLTGIVVGMATTLFVAGTYFSPTKDSTPSKPVPAVSTPAAPAPASGYDPQGKNLKQLESDLYTFIERPHPAGEELTNLGPGCNTVLEQVYTRMGGLAEGKDYFLRNMAVSDFCNMIPKDNLVKLGGTIKP